MKQNVSETESNRRFRKNVENMSTKQESVSETTFKVWPFSSVFNIGCKDGQAHPMKPFASFYRYQLLQRTPS